MIQTIFLQNNTNFKPLNRKDKVNLILSPIFYWVKVFTIPVENENKALFLLPNLFEDYFDIAGYSFYTIKVDENKYLSFAYDEEKILEKLKSLNIPQNKIQRIYFAQNEFQKMNRVDENNLLTYGEETYMFDKELLIQIPQNLLLKKDKQEIDLDSLSLSNHFIELFSYKKLTSNKSAQFASGLLLGFAILLFLQTFIYKNMANEYPQKIEAIKEEYNLPPTLIQANAIVESYSKSQREYKKARDAISYAVGANSLGNTTIVGIHLEKNILSLYYNAKDIDTLEAYLKKEFRKVSINDEDGKIKARIEL